MDIYKELKLKPVQTEPDVWVSRLVIFEQITPEPVVVRDITLSRGLNIIWAEEAEDDDPAEITGHSAGKTTFCRLLRYCLGEKTYGAKNNMELIEKALPEGYVSAELYVRGKKWAVLRPIGKGRNSYIKPDATIEELLQDRTRPAYQHTYVNELGLERLLDEMETGGIVRTGEPIEWEHILAWCTRDQEARFQSIHEWRSPRSGSDTPAFRFSKADPLFVMRATLGLFLPDELKGEEKLAKLLRQKDDLAQQLDKKKREPQFRIKLHDEQLRQRLKIIFPNEKDLDTRPFHSEALLPEDLNRLTDRAVAQAEEAMDEPGKDYIKLQEQIDDSGGKIKHHENRLAMLDRLSDLSTASSKELNGRISQHQKQRDLLDLYGDRMCLGGILYRDCDEVQKRMNALQFTQLQDKRAMAQAEAKRKEALDKIEQEKKGIRKIIDGLKIERQKVLAKRDAHLAMIQKKREEARDLKRIREELKTWTEKIIQPGGYEELDNVRKKLEATEQEISKIENELVKLLREHDQNRELLRSIFSGAVRSVLPSGNYDGEVSLENRELAFRITHGSVMSGEAVETLSVLLSDIASLIYNTVSDKARLPGFLLHDSPREADLGIRIYRSFIRFVASLQEHFGELDNCPFQYILTTTTPPPRELQNEEFVKLPLNASEPSGMLLGRSIATVITKDDNPGLF